MAATPTFPVTFVYADWVALFPEFSYLPEPQAQLYFGLANNIRDNTGQNPNLGGPYPSGTLAGPAAATASANFNQQQTNLQYLLTAHIAKLLASTAAGQPSSDIVGRIDSATEGSVSVSAMMETPKNASWFMQTKYGAMYWQATMVDRTMRYRPPMRRAGNALFGIGPGWWR